jgi:prevent-host-death family protein
LPQKISADLAVAALRLKAMDVLIRGCQRQFPSNADFVENTYFPCYSGVEAMDPGRTGIPMTKVTSGEFQKEFGRYRALAHREPVIITNHGRDDVVLLGVDDYARLRRYEQRAFHVSELPDEVIGEMGKSSPPAEAAAFDHEYK